MRFPMSAPLRLGVACLVKVGLCVVKLLEDDADDTVSLDDLADVPGDEEEL